jgi:hypothetical protein
VEILGNNVYKIFSKILSERLRPTYLTANTGKNERTEHTAFYLFVNFKTTFDSAIREQLYAKMLEIGIPMKLVKLSRAALKSVRSRVTIQGLTSETFEVKRDLRQRSSLSCYLFNLALERVIRDAKLDVKDTNIYTRTVQIMAYADDLVILGRTIQAMKEAFMALETSARKKGLAVNEEKTKLMEVGKKLTTVAHFTVVNYEFEKVHMFKYLGS